MCFTGGLMIPNVFVATDCADCLVNTRKMLLLYGQMSFHQLTAVIIIILITAHFHAAHCGTFQHVSDHICADT